MLRKSLKTARYVGAWITGRDDVVSKELALDRDGVRVPATYLTPRNRMGPLPTWIVLHGITRPGRGHAQLVRFTRALASSGCSVLVPDVPEWRELRLAPHLTAPTVLAGLRALDDGAAVPTGLVGFSFGAPQAIAASAHPDIRPRVSGVVGFGGYCDLERTLVFQFTGRHEWMGDVQRVPPDPYGRWIAGANYLTEVPHHEDEHPVSGGLRQLAALAGDLGVVAWDPRLDPVKGEIRARLPVGMRPTFDLFAPPLGDPDPDAAEELAHGLAAAARRVDPGVEPAPALASVAGPVHILHGRQDHLIPSSEAMRLHHALPAGVEAHVTVTRLFGHSAQDALPGWREGAREGVRFLKALGSILGLL